MFKTFRQSSWSRHLGLILASLLLTAPVQAASKTVDLDGDGGSDTIILRVLQSWPPRIQVRVINRGAANVNFNYLNAGPGGVRSRANAYGESRWTYTTATTLYSFTGSACRNDMCSFDRNGNILGGAFRVPGRTVVSGQATTSAASLTSSLIQSFSPGVPQLECTSRYDLLDNGNFGYTTTCLNAGDQSVSFELDEQPLGCCSEPDQLRCEVYDGWADTPNEVPDGDDPTASGSEAICVNYLEDPLNCGGCGNECGAAEFCSAGSCTSICPPETDLTLVDFCGLDRSDPDGYCADFSSDRQNCGGCGVECGNSEICTDTDGDGLGTCEGCPRNLKNVCDNECVNIRNDPNNCGGCAPPEGDGVDCDEFCPNGPGANVCSNGRSCQCNDGSEAALSMPFGRVRHDASSYRFATSPLDGPAKNGHLPPAAPVCAPGTGGTSGEILPGQSYSFCFASPYLPVEVDGSITACGGDIAEGSAVCDASLGTQGTFQQLAPNGPIPYEENAFGVLPEEVALRVAGVRLISDNDDDNLVELGETACFNIDVAQFGTADLRNVTLFVDSPMIDLDCGEGITEDACDPATISGGAGPAGVIFTTSQTLDLGVDLDGVHQTDRGNGSCAVPLASPNVVGTVQDVCFIIPSDHPGDLARPFGVEFGGEYWDGTEWVAFGTALPAKAGGIPDTQFAIGITGLCDVDAGDFPDSVFGLFDLAPLVSTDDLAPFPASRVADAPVLAFSAMCDGEAVANTIAYQFPSAPDDPVRHRVGRLLSLVGENTVTPTLPGDLLFEYDSASDEWRFDTAGLGLAPDRYVATIRINDELDFHSGFELCADDDDDGLCNDEDNCPTVANPDQSDTDGDGDGDVCDACPDDPTNDGSDGDGVCDDVDNCVGTPNADQADSDGDGPGDACDVCPFDPTNDGSDHDGVCDDVDNCFGAANPDQADGDGDGAGDVCDVCPLDAANDSDGDGLCDSDDGCPADGDKTEPGACGCGVSDIDSDVDGTPDCLDACPADAEKTSSGLCGCGVTDGIAGLESPMAALNPCADDNGDGVCDGPIEYPRNPFNQGNTRPLKMTLTCDGTVVRANDLEQAPEIVSLIDAAGVEYVGMVDISDNRGGPNPDAPFFRFNQSSGTWIFNLRTEDLPVGTLELRIHIGAPAHSGGSTATDELDYRTGFGLR